MKIRDTRETLANQPGACQERKGFGVVGCRSLSVGQYVVFFRSIDGGVRQALRDDFLDCSQLEFAAECSTCVHRSVLLSEKSDMRRSTVNFSWAIPERDWRSMLPIGDALVVRTNANRRR